MFLKNCFQFYYFENSLIRKNHYFEDDISIDLSVIHYHRIKTTLKSKRIRMLISPGTKIPLGKQLSTFPVRDL